MLSTLDALLRLLLLFAVTGTGLAILVSAKALRDFCLRAAVASLAGMLWLGIMATYLGEATNDIATRGKALALDPVVAVPVLVGLVSFGVWIGRWRARKTRHEHTQADLQTARRRGRERIAPDDDHAGFP